MQPKDYRLVLRTNCDICQVIEKSSTCATTNVFHDDDDVEKQRIDYDLDFASLADVKETVIDDNASDEELDNSGVRMRLKNRKKQPTRRRKQVQLCSSVV